MTIFPHLRELARKYMSKVDDGKLLSLNLKVDNITFGIASQEEYLYLRKFPQIYQALMGGYPSSQGIGVSFETALTLPVVFAIYRLIVETMGSLPFNLKQKQGQNTVDNENHPMFAAMQSVPNDEMSAFTLREVMTGHCMFHGNAFAQIMRRSGGTRAAMELVPLKPNQVKVERNSKSKLLVYSILNNNGGTEKEFILKPGEPQDIFHLRGLSWDGVQGVSVLNAARESVATGLMQEQAVNAMLRLGGRVPAVIEMEKKFAEEEDKDDWEKKFAKKYSDWAKTISLEPGMKWIKTGMTMAESQMLEGRKFTVTDLTRFWGASPHLVSDLSQATFSNIEQLFAEFKSITATRWAKRWEQDFDRCVLTPDERRLKNFMKVNINAFMRGEFVTRIEAYAKMVQNGLMSKNEIRQLEDLNRIPGDGGDSFTQQLNMQTVPGTGPETAAEAAMRSRVSVGKPNQQAQQGAQTQ